MCHAARQYSYLDFLTVIQLVTEQKVKFMSVAGKYVCSTVHAF